VNRLPFPPITTRLDRYGVTRSSTGAWVVVVVLDAVVRLCSSAWRSWKSSSRKIVVVVSHLPGLRKARAARRTRAMATIEGRGGRVHSSIDGCSSVVRRMCSARARPSMACIRDRVGVLVMANLASRAACAPRRAPVVYEHTDGRIGQTMASCDVVWDDRRARGRRGLPHSFTDWTAKAHVWSLERWFRRHPMGHNVARIRVRFRWGVTASRDAEILTRDRLRRLLEDRQRVNRYRTAAGTSIRRSRASPPAGRALDVSPLHRYASATRCDGLDGGVSVSPVSRLTTQLVSRCERPTDQE